jgi:hypothetical protein
MRSAERARAHYILPMRQHGEIKRASNAAQQYSAKGIRHYPFRFSPAGRTLLDT